MDRKTMKEALETLLGKHETEMALASAAEHPAEISGKVLRSEQAGWW